LTGRWRPAEHEDSSDRLRRGDWVVALALVALAAVLRFPRLAETPGWDGDEGYNLEIAWQLLHGRAQAFATSYAFVQHPILPYAVAAPLVAAFGRELWVIRALAAAAGAASAGLLYLAAATTGDRRAALLAGVAFAGTHFTVTYNRWGYTYNLLLFWTALTLLLTLRADRFKRPRAVVAPSIAAGLGLLTDQIGISLPLFVAACAALPSAPRRRSHAAQALAIGLLPAGLAALGALLWEPQAALADWPHTVSRLFADGGAAPAAGAATAAARWLVNYLHLLRAEWWWPAAVAGLLCIQPLAARRRVLLLTGLLVLPTFSLRELEPSFRTGIPLLLPAAWGLGTLLSAGIRAVYATIGVRSAGGEASAALNRAAAIAAAAFVVILPLGLEFGRSAGALVTGFAIRIDWALVHDRAHAREAAALVQARRAPGEVVIASPHVTWLYEHPVADFFQSIARGGEAVAFYPAAMPPSRFRFDPSPQHARFAVIDAYWELWASESRAVAHLVAECERWPLLWQGGEYRVYRRPDAMAQGGAPGGE
jgi:4-amino-4-deoxy-L-arabinose transferase-like glycosyltransferase